MRHLLTVTRVYKHVNGSPLGQSLTTTWSDGSRLKLESAVDFDLDGGEGVFEPGTAREEIFLYSSADEATDELVGVTRPNTKYAHASGTFVQEGVEATVEKLADGYLDDEQVPAVGIPVPPSLYPLLKVGAREDETAETIWVSTNQEEDLFVSEGPVGAVPVFDEDLEVLPAVGGGDATQSVVQPDGAVLPPKGMGYEDGKPPETDVVSTLVGGIGTLFVRFPTISNNSQVTYKVHIHTTSGFTPAANTQVGTLVLSGTPGSTGVVSVKDFPGGHILDATVSDPPKAGTTYYAKVVAADGSGDYVGPYTQASGSPVQIQTVDIGPAAIDLATHVQGLLPNANLSQITDPAKLADAIVTGAKIAVGTIDASSKLVAGTIVGNLIAADAIASTHLAAGSVVAGKIAANAVTATEIAANTITSDQIAGRSVIAGDIVTGTLTGNEIAGTTITADKMSVSSLSAISANIGTITAGSITGVTVTGGTLQTATTGLRVVITSTTSDRITFYNGSTVQAAIIGGFGGSGGLGIDSAGGDLVLASGGVVRMTAKPDFRGGTAAASGGLAGYVLARVDGIERKIPYHLV